MPKGKGKRSAPEPAKIREGRVSARYDVKPGERHAYDQPQWRAAKLERSGYPQGDDYDDVVEQTFPASDSPPGP